jgi:hypothetical protein
MTRFLCLLLLFFLSQAFFDLESNPLILANILEQDAVLGFSVLVLLMYLFKIPVRKLKSYNIYRNLFIYCFISNLIMSYLNLHQPLVFSLLTGRLYITYFILMLALVTLINGIDINLDKLNKLLIGIALFLVLINLYVYKSHNFGLINGLVILERFDTARFLVGGLSVIYLTIYFYENISFSRSNTIVFFALLFILFLVSKSRGIIIPISLIILKDLFFNKKIFQGKLIRRVTLILFLTIFIIWNPGNVLKSGQKIIALAQSDISQNSGNFGFRIDEATYYLQMLDLKSLVFGYGMENKKVSDILSVYDYYLSDLGIFRILFTSGIIGLSLFVLSLYYLYKEAGYGDTVIHKFGKGFVLFQLFSFPTITFYYYAGGVFIFLFLMILLIKINSENQYINLNGEADYR